MLFTFDDGPVPGNTEVILNKLNEHNIKALFFCVGNNVKKYPELVKEILAEGHTIGNHTLNHKNVTDKDFNPVTEIKDINESTSDRFGVDIKYFRPPHGRFNLSTPKLIKDYGMRSVMWTLLTYDYKNDLAEVKKSASGYLKNNSIIVLHDSLKSKSIISDSIDFLAGEIKRKGFQIGTPEECLK